MPGMPPGESASAWSERAVAAVRDDPAARLRLLEQTYRHRVDGRPTYLPYRRAAVSFMRWQLRRGVLAPLHGDRPGSPWWRAVNERLLRDGCEAIARATGRPGPASSSAVEHWDHFVRSPSAASWYRAHNASVVAGFVAHHDLAAAESEAERFFCNVVLVRVLYAHALVAEPRLSLGWLSPIARLLGDPRLGMTTMFLQLSRVLPDAYPLRADVSVFLRAELGVGRTLDYGIILPRLDELFAWSARELGTPELLGFARDGLPAYVWPAERADVWETGRTAPMRFIEAVLPVR